jgi:hypothetical protein
LCCVALLPSLLVISAVTKPTKLVERDTLRLALPSKGRMAEDTMQLLKVRRQACTAGLSAGLQSAAPSAALVCLLQ